MSVFSRNLKITNLLHVKRFFFVNTCKSALLRRSPNEQMGEFAHSKTLELEKSLLTVAKGRAQKPQPCPAHCELGCVKHLSKSRQAAGLVWNLAFWKPQQTKIFLLHLMMFLPLLSAPTPSSLSLHFPFNVSSPL